MSRLVKQDKRHKSGYQLPCDYSNYHDDVFIKLGKIEDLMEKYEIEDLTDLEIALDYYYHRFDGVHTERVDNDE